jgi:hypothetical protein
MSEYNIASVADLVLLSNIAHIEQFLVMEGEKLTSTVKVSANEDRSDRPENHFLYHKHTNHGSSET